MQSAKTLLYIRYSYATHCVVIFLLKNYLLKILTNGNPLPCCLFIYTDWIISDFHMVSLVVASLLILFLLPIIACYCYMGNVN